METPRQTETEKHKPPRNRMDVERKEMSSSDKSGKYQLTWEFLRASFDDLEFMMSN